MLAGENHQKGVANGETNCKGEDFPHSFGEDSREFFKEETRREGKKQNKNRKGDEDVTGESSIGESGVIENGGENANRSSIFCSNEKEIKGNHRNGGLNYLGACKKGRLKKSKELAKTLKREIPSRLYYEVERRSPSHNGKNLRCTENVETMHDSLLHNNNSRSKLIKINDERNNSNFCCKDEKPVKGTTNLKSKHGDRDNMVEHCSDNKGLLDDGGGTRDEGNSEPSGGSDGEKEGQIFIAHSEKMNNSGTVVRKQACDQKWEKKGEEKEGGKRGVIGEVNEGVKEGAKGNTTEKVPVMSKFSKADEAEIRKEDILLQYEKYNRKKRRKKKKKKKKIKSKLFRKSVIYSNYSGPDILNMLNQMKLNLSFYQREVDDFLNVIRNLQNIVLIEREKYCELKEMLKYTTEEIEKENNKLYEELNIYKQKYNKLRSVISNIGYGIFFNINDEEVKNGTYCNRENNAYRNCEKFYTEEIPEQHGEYDYVMINGKFSAGNNGTYDNKYVRRGRHRNNSSLLKYLDF
ncbi:conserved Plasmodium protein, unknown function [Plasmodium ovale curtisi]|nr:conserved Plasmodium protein, unknown function [Plasmodium ovale curtisi]